MKRLIWVLLMAFTVSSAGYAGYVITGEIQGAEGQAVVLKQFRDLKPTDVDRTVVQNGKFTLKGITACPEFCMLYVGDKGPVQFFVENSNIHITVDINNISQSKVTGSKENDIFAEFVDGVNKFARQQQQINDTYASLSTSGNVTPETEQGLMAQMQKLQGEHNRYMVNFVSQHPGRVSTAFIIIANNSLIGHLDMPQLEKITGSYDSQAGESQWVQMLKRNYASLRRTAIGQPFPDITLKTPDDRPMSLSDYAGRGKYVLVDFWASWCGPCRNANPQVVELYNRYRDKGFEIVGISLDRGKKEWVEAIRKDKLAWPQMSDLNYWQSEAAKLYSVSAIPYTVLLDKDGKIIAKGLYVAELAQKLSELLD
jgi:thiol-disulfide isomerase/thioredoxin